MNGNFRTHSDDDHDEGLDPDLTQLFDTSISLAPVTGEAFVSSVLLKMQRARRLRLMRQVASVTLIMVIGAFVAPYAAQGTLLVASWLMESQSGTGTVAFVSPIGYICASLIAWRIARWARTS
jgi:hypothetical protein